MEKQLGNLFFALLAIFFTSCQTLPTPQGQEECLLALGILKEGLDLKKVYLVELAVRSTADNELIREVNIPLRKGLVFVPGLRPGNYRLLFSVRTGLWDVKEEKYLADVSLKPGHLTLAKVGVFINFYYQNEVFPIYEFEPKTLTSADYQYFRRQLEADPNFARWKYQEGDIDYSSPPTLEPVQPAQGDEVTPISP